MKNSQATIRDLALKLNISISTVSRALRNAPDVNPETKKAVRELAKKLNYEPNRVAQSLRIKKTNTIGVVVPEIAMHFFSSAIGAIQEYTAKHQYSIMICQSMETLRMEKSNIHMLVSNRVDGLLISLSTQTKNVDHLQQLIEKKIPIVLFDRIDNSLDVSKVVVDDRAGAFKAVEHLIHTGCTKIAYVGGPDNLYVSNERMNGYMDALRKHNLPIDESLILHCKDLRADVGEATRSLLDRKDRPDAIFAMNDPIAIAVLQVLRQAHVAVPDEISLVGFTDEPVSQFMHPALTTVAQPSYTIGQEAAKLLMQQINNKEGFVPVTKVLHTELIVRESTRALKK
ncbi:LacI family DNA-binding transcriptional regulator [Pseudochryseolinea flava]|uniref:LacI family transcriptional regulator n=1 Tax=Pseudochryseolinea flava TaxID=2059302 RepID=A0A364Y6Q9_9BACT|nr:LacI family DNA-binding transcriptional regulator [Pseudochryseolinea flava]RAW01905.1 LacI family transcriptional regulator [Pseudochryseolinea flava]